MAISKAVTYVILAFGLCSPALAQANAGSVAIAPPVNPIANDNCGPDVKSCDGADTHTVIEYVGEPVYVTTNVTAISTKVHTTTSTSIVPVVKTSIRTNRGICEMVTTRKVTTRETIPITRTVTSIEHRVTSVIATSTQTYIEYLEGVSACIMTIPFPVFTAAARAPQAVLDGQAFASDAAAAAAADDRQDMLE